MWLWKGIPVAFARAKIHLHLGPSGEMGVFVEAHVGEDIWLKEQGRLQREPQRSQDGTDGWGGVASPASQAQIPVFPGDHAPRGWAYRMKVYRGTSNTPLGPDAHVKPEVGEEDFSAPSWTAAGF